MVEIFFAKIRFIITQGDDTVGIFVPNIKGNGRKQKPNKKIEKISYIHWKTTKHNNLNIQLNACDNKNI